MGMGPDHLTCLLRNLYAGRIRSDQIRSVAQSCPTLCDPMNRRTPGFPVHHQLPEFTQTHVHQVSDAIQPSHPLSSPSPPAPNPSQHQVRKQQLELDMEQKTNWFQIEKGVCQGCILSPCLFNLYAEYIMRNTGLEEAQAGIKIAKRNINNLRYADDITLMAESEEELRSLLMKVKEESGKSWLKAQHSEN